MSREKSDRTLKIFAFIIAIVLWTYVMSEVNPDETRDYRINVSLDNQISLDREGLRVMEPEEVTVSVKVTGTRSDMLDFSSQSIKASLDLSGYDEGQKKVPINVKLDQVSNIRITSYEPKEVLFTFDRLIEEEKPVTIETTGKLDPGYILGGLETESETILLKGPRSWVNEVSKVIATVNLDGRKADGKILAPIRLENSQGNDVRGVEKEPSTIDIRVPILRTTNIPIELKTENQLPENYEITEVSISPSNIGIKGDKDILKLATIQTKPVDINDLIGDTEMEVELDLPEGVQLLDPSQKVVVRLKVEESIWKTFSYNLDEVEIQNLDNNLSIDEDEYSKSIRIRLKGTKESIEELTKDDLQLYVDLSTSTEGLNQVYINVNIPIGITIEEIIPQPIEILLIED